MLEKQGMIPKFFWEGTPKISFLINYSWVIHECSFCCGRYLWYMVRTMKFMVPICNDLKIGSGKFSHMFISGSSHHSEIIFTVKASKQSHDTLEFLGGEISVHLLCITALEKVYLMTWFQVRSALKLLIALEMRNKHAKELFP